MNVDSCWDSGCIAYKYLFCGPLGCMAYTSPSPFFLQNSIINSYQRSYILLIILKNKEPQNGLLILMSVYARHCQRPLLCYVLHSYILVISIFIGPGRRRGLSSCSLSASQINSRRLTGLSVQIDILLSGTIRTLVYI